MTLRGLLIFLFAAVLVNGCKSLESSRVEQYLAPAASLPNPEAGKDSVPTIRTRVGDFVWDSSFVAVYLARRANEIEVETVVPKRLGEQPVDAGHIWISLVFKNGSTLSATVTLGPSVGNAGSIDYRYVAHILEQRLSPNRSRPWRFRPTVIFTVSRSALWNNGKPDLLSQRHQPGAGHVKGKIALVTLAGSGIGQGRRFNGQSGGPVWTTYVIHLGCQLREARCNFFVCPDESSEQGECKCHGG